MKNRMETSNIKALLERYWEGETSIEEERMLKTYFSQEQIDAELRDVAPLFRMLKSEKDLSYSRQHPAPARFWGSPLLAVAAMMVLLVSAALWWWNAQTPNNRVGMGPVAAVSTPAVEKVNEPQEKMVAMEASVKSPARKPVFRKRKAAAIAIHEDASVEEARQAMEEIKSALAFLSGKMKRGKNEVDKVLQEVDHVELFKKKSPGEGS